eukprot:1144257-Pelagomonas_calceolata.AAC.3
MQGMSRAQQQQLLAEYKHKSPGVSDVSPGGAAAWGLNVAPTPRVPLPDVPAFKLKMVGFHVSCVEHGHFDYVSS